MGLNGFHIPGFSDRRYNTNKCMPYNKIQLGINRMSCKFTFLNYQPESPVFAAAAENLFNI